MAEMAGLSADQWNGVLCSVEKMGNYFIFPASLNVTHLTTQLCGIDVAALWPELQTEFNLGHLMAAVGTIRLHFKVSKAGIYCIYWNMTFSLISFFIKSTNICIQPFLLCRLH